MARIMMEGCFQTRLRRLIVRGCYRQLPSSNLENQKAQTASAGPACVIINNGGNRRTKIMRLTLMLRARTRKMDKLKNKSICDNESFARRHGLRSPAETFLASVSSH